MGPAGFEPSTLTKNGYITYILETITIITLFIRAILFSTIYNSKIQISI